MSLLPPDTSGYRDYTATSLRIEWSIQTLGNNTAGWLVLGVDRNGVESIIATAALADRAAVAFVPAAMLQRFYIVAIDVAGTRSAPGPMVFVGTEVGGPTVLFDPWQVNFSNASCAWAVLSKSFLSSITYAITAGSQTLSGSSSAIGAASIPVAGYVGDVSLAVTAVDYQGRATTAVTHVYVDSHIPATPTVTASDLTSGSMTVTVVPTDTVQSAQIFGFGNPVTVTAPFTYTFTGLRANTTYVIQARTANAGGTFSALSAPLTLITPIDPSLPPVVPLNPGDPVDLLRAISSLMFGSVAGYLLQYESDTRRRDPLAPQISRVPPALYQVLDLVEPIKDRFGALMRRASKDPQVYRASVEVDRVGDTLSKLVLYAELLEYGFIWGT